MKNLEVISSKKTTIFIFILLFFIILIKTAWICDDAYISFRTVYNLVHGYGLTWNITERVQSYTNPLWLFLITPVYLIFEDIWISSHFLSIAISLGAVYIVLCKIARSYTASIIAGLIFIFSNAFIDYSTSGLENPLTHLLLGIFFYLVFYQRQGNFQHILLLSLITSLLMLNRLDTFLLTSPTLAWAIFQKVNFRTITMAAIGMLPFLIWETFSLTYYGFLFPNTAYAKLNTGVWQVSIFIEGIKYLLDSIGNDPVTLFIILLVIIFAWQQKAWQVSPLLIGVILYLIYLVKIGGDFMGGRFLSAPLFCSVIALTQLNLPELQQGLASLSSWCIVAIILVLGLSAPFPPVLSNAAYGEFPSHLSKITGYNTRSHYYQRTGLLKLHRDWTRGKPHPAFIGGDYQLLAGSCELEKTPIVHGGMGMLGFDAGPKCYIIDALALTDPFLSKLPAIQTDWRPGHYRRKLPRGYLASLRYGKNLIQDKQLAKLYDQIQIVTRGELFSYKRWQAILELNLGKYRDLIAKSKELSYPETRIRLAELSETKPEGTPYYDANENFTTDRLVIELEKVFYAHTLDLTVDHKQDYLLAVYKSGKKLFEITLFSTLGPKGGLKQHLVRLPEEVAKIGFDRITLEAIHDRQDEKQKWIRFYSIGHLHIF